jgi:hypothetical protein
MLITLGFKSNIFHHLTVFTPGSMNKNNNGLWVFWITFLPLKGISFQLGKTGWNYYNQEESIKINLFFIAFFSF